MTAHTGSAIELARALIEAADKSVGAHCSEPYRLRIATCARMWSRYVVDSLAILARDIGAKVDGATEIGKPTRSDSEAAGPLIAACSDRRALGHPASLFRYPWRVYRELQR